MKRNHIFMGILLTVLSSPVFSAGGIVFDPTNYAENAITSAKSIETALNTAKSLQSSLQQLDNMKENLQKFSNFQWSTASDDLQNLAGVIRTGNSIAYNMENIGDEFQKRYPGYQPPKDYNKEYQGWSGSTMDTLKGTLSSASLQSQQFADEASTIATLKNMAQTSDGQVQAVQVGSMIAAETVNSLQKLRQIQLSQMNAQNAYMAYQVQKDQAERAQMNDIVSKMSTDSKYEDKGFGKIPYF